MESPTPSSRYTAQSSKKRVFPGEDSSPEFKDMEKGQSSKFKQEEVVCEIIDVDMEEDCGDRKGKGKLKENSSNASVDLNNLSDDGYGNDVQMSKDMNIDDDLDSNLFFEEDECEEDTYYDDLTFDDYTVLESQFDNIDIPPDVEVTFPWLQNKTNSTSTSSSDQIKANGDNPDLDRESSSSDTSLKLKSTEIKDLIVSLHSNKGSRADRQLGKEALEEKKDYADGKNREPPAMGVAEIFQSFDLFKKFDTVEDFSDHFYAKNGSSSKQPPKNWAKRIQEEWKILESNLPDAVFVRVYESRMDLLRAVIIGAQGTPYHDGLFFFDVYFPDSYPNIPPLVHYHSGGLRINPNLYNCGKVCLSLLNTWSGDQKEKWVPGVSTMLQVLVSIQGLILNAEPYFNEPGWERTKGTKDGDKKALDYNETTFIHNLQTMVYTMRKPPKHFESFVAGYFCKHARDILVTCKAYMEGVQVGCHVRGGVQDVDEGDKSCSDYFKVSLGGFTNTLIDMLSQIRAKDCEEFRSLAEIKVEGKGLKLGRYY